MNFSINPGTLIAKGATAKVYKINNSQVLKLFDSDPIEGAIEYEYKASKEIYKRGLSVPEVFDKIMYEGKVGIIYEFIPGEIMNDLLYSNPSDAEQLGEELARIHWEIHKAADIEGLLSPKVLMNLILSHNHYLQAGEIDPVFNYIDSLPDGNHLCHGDFHLNNIVLQQGKAITIDWMGATSGHPLFDVARTWVWLYYSAMPEHTPVQEQQYNNKINRRLVNRYLEKYLEISGYHEDEFNQWKLPLLAMRLDGTITKLTEQEVRKEFDRLLNKYCN
jgi:tRNA A-37 threonylcarbamoyl transferase component Bud32